MKLQQYTLVFIVMVILVGCGHKKGGEYPRNETLYVGGFQTGAPVSFNPLSAWPVSWPSTAGVNLVYETLFAFNTLTAELEPLIGAEYELDGRNLTVMIQQGAHWSDKTPLTVDDVLYTFYLHKRYQTLHHTIWRFIDTIDVNQREQSVTFTLDKGNYNPLTVKDMLTSVFMLPKHVYLPLEEAAKKKHASLKKDHSAFQAKVLEEMLLNNFMVKSVGSGPYVIYDHSDERIVLMRDSLYWGNTVMYGGKLPAPKYIIHPIYASDELSNQALANGQLDMSSTYCPMVWNMKKNGVGTWESSEPYYIPGSIPSLLVQHMSTPDTQMVFGKDTVTMTKASLQSAVFRRALAASIDYEMIRKRAIQGYAPPIVPGFVLNSGIEEIYYDDSIANQYGAFNSKNYGDLKARQTLLKKELADSGYTWIPDPTNPAGRLVHPDGRVLADLKITSPKGWSDWEIAIEIAVAGMRNVGVPAVVDLVDDDLYWANLGLGKFDMIMKTPQADQLPSLPWSRYEKVMSSNDIDSIGVYIYTNEGRYVNKKADSLLVVIPTLHGDDELEIAYRTLNELFIREMPVIPLMYRPSMFYQFSSTVWKGFPTLDNPYAPPSCLMVAAGRKALWSISSADNK